MLNNHNKDRKEMRREKQENKLRLITDPKSLFTQDTVIYQGLVLTMSHTLQLVKIRFLLLTKYSSSFFMCTVPVPFCDVYKSLIMSSVLINRPNSKTWIWFIYHSQKCILTAGLILHNTLHYYYRFPFKYMKIHYVCEQ